MAALEFFGSRQRQLFALEGDRVSIGRGRDSEVDVSLNDDRAVSHVHAILERIGNVWSIRDLDSANGTQVNGKPLTGGHVLRDGDEIIVGKTILTYRDRTVQAEPPTDRLAKAPTLTRREKEVLVELCRPVLSGSAFTPPASTREIAAALVISEAAVKQHLKRLQDKFGISDQGRESPRVRLANAALQSGAVTIADLRDDPPEDGSPKDGPRK